MLIAEYTFAHPSGSWLLFLAESGNTVWSITCAENKEYESVLVSGNLVSPTPTVTIPTNDVTDATWSIRVAGDPIVIWVYMLSVPVTFATVLFLITSFTIASIWL